MSLSDIESLLAIVCIGYLCKDLFEVLEPRIPQIPRSFSQHAFYFVARLALGLSFLCAPFHCLIHLFDSRN